MIITTSRIRTLLDNICDDRTFNVALPHLFLFVDVDPFSALHTFAPVSLSLHPGLILLLYSPYPLTLFTLILSLYSLHPLPLFAPSSPSLHSILSLYSPHPLPLFTLILSLSSPHPLTLFTLSSPSIHPILSLYSLHPLPLFTLSSPSIHPILPSAHLQADPSKPKKVVGKKLGTDIKSGGGLNPLAIIALLIAIACGVFFSKMKK